MVNACCNRERLRNSFAGILSSQSKITDSGQISHVARTSLIYPTTVMEHENRAQVDLDSDIVVKADGSPKEVGLIGDRPATGRAPTSTINENG